MSNHTPGPWHIGGLGSASAEISKSNAVRVWAADRAGVTDLCVRKSIHETGPSAEMLANARLIAAAPDLLAALTMIYQTIKEDRNLDPWLKERMSAAIAKAEGK